VGGIVGGKGAAETASNLAGAERNLTNQAFGTSVRNVLGQNSSYVKNGGAISSNYQPQIATELEGIPLTRLFAPDPYMDTLRTGGNVRQNNVGMDGDLRTHWGGGIKTLSRNPYRDGSGKIEILEGNSHEEKDKYGRTGIGISVGDTGNSPFQDYAEYGSKLATGKADVEAEKGEPVTEKMEPDGSISAVVHGNLLLSKANAEMIGMPEYANMKIKDATAKIGDKEKKINKRIESSVTKLNKLNPNNSYDLLSFNTEKFNIEAGIPALITTADQTNRLASIQDAINRTADENGFNADALAKGKVKQAKMGAKLSIAKDGITKEQRAEAKRLYESGDIDAFQTYAQQIAPDIIKDVLRSKGLPKSGKFVDNLKGPRTEEVYQRLMNPIANELPGSRLPERKPGIQLPANMPGVSTERPGATSDEPGKFDKNIADAMMMYANQILPYLRPSNAEELDPRQLSGEMYALSTNQLQPVDAQLFQPQLSTPYDISLQDQLNANQSDYRAAQRMMGYNPAAQAMLNAQKYQANQQVLGEQFRMNQAMRDKVYGENRQLLDQAKLQNLGILDQQYGRQQQALSNTKATTQAALNSISAKYAQNQLENRKSQTLANMYKDFGFDPRFRAIKTGGLAQFDTEVDGEITMLDKEGNPVTYVKQEQKYDEKNLPAGRKVTTTTKQSVKNGALVKGVK
jgi:hypothetical protein